MIVESVVVLGMCAGFGVLVFLWVVMAVRAFREGTGWGLLVLGSVCLPPLGLLPLIGCWEQLRGPWAYTWVVYGIFGTIAGVNEVGNQWHATEDPEVVDVAVLESEGMPANPHVRLSPHVRLGSRAFYTYRTSPSERAEADRYVTDLYVPALSTGHRDLQAANADPNAPARIRLLVLEEYYGTVGRIDDRDVQADDVTGMLTDVVPDLVEDEFGADVLILEEGKTPDQAFGWVLLLLGASMVLFGSLGGRAWWNLDPYADFG